MKYGSVCSGIEAATAAWHKLGWEPQWFSEIEPFPCAVLAHHYPDVPNLGDMTKVHETEVYRERAIELLVGGTPCQSFSVAGLRKGLDDPRGNLALVFLRVLALSRARWVLWENVPGVLSSAGGRDFAAFLGGLTGRDIKPPHEGWKNAGVIPPAGGGNFGVAYRVLDAQYFGVPQRRRRVFVVGYLGDWRPPAAVLFESDSLHRDSTPGSEEGEGPSPRPEDGPRTRSHWEGGPHPCLNQSASGSGGVGSSNQEIFSQRGAYLVPGEGRELPPSSLTSEPPSLVRMREGKDGGGNGPLVSKDASLTLATGNDQILFAPEKTEPFEYIVVLEERGTGELFDVRARWEHGQDALIYQWTTGNYSCDCNRALFISEMEYPEDEGTAPCCGQYDDEQFILRSIGIVEGGATRDIYAPDGPKIFDMRGNGDGKVSPTLTREAAGDRPSDMAPMIFTPGNIKRGAGARPSLHLAPTLAASHGRGASDQDPHVCVPSAKAAPLVFDPNQVTSKANRSNPKPGDPCHTIPATEQPPMITEPTAFQQNSRSEVREMGGNVCGAVTAEPGAQGQNYIAEPTYAIQERAVSEGKSGPDGKGFQEGVAFTMEARTRPQNVAAGMAVRRLTPVECERLQGFPDNYTRIPWRGKPAEECPDGPRYKANGNSMARVVMEWLGRRIDAVDKTLQAAVSP